MCGIICTPDEPVPMTPTRSPLKSTPSCGHRPVWYHLPLKLFRPGMLGVRGVERLPVAMTQNGAVTVSPLSVLTVHRLVLLLKAADRMRVLS